MIEVNAQIRDADRRRLAQQFHQAERALPVAMKTAINQVARQQKRELLRAAKKRYQVKPDKLNKSISLKSATNQSLVAVIRVKGRPLPIIYFRTSPNTKTRAVKAKVLKRSTMKELAIAGADRNGKSLKAFLTKVKYGSGEQAGQHQGVFRRVSAYSRKIEQIYGVSAPQMIANPEVLKMDKIQELVQKQIQVQLEKKVFH